MTTSRTPSTGVSAAGAGSAQAAAGVEDIEFVSPPANVSDVVDDDSRGCHRRYRTVSNVLATTEPVAAQADEDGEPDEHLHLATEEPTSFDEAATDPAWRAAMEAEMAAIEDNGTWEAVDLPAGHRPIGLKWVFKLKKDAQGSVIRHKARLVAKGYVQRAGVDFDEVFAPVARLDSVRALAAVAAHEGWALHHLDVKSAFLNGDLTEEVYVAQPPGFTIAGRE
ncbi:hypothetical protein E2562_020197 [Oryza meyeriana var. granulata]|uniref:Reverse transcriptase Ty1/copia-type domain-containing protein n=2 Tax=Oryza meyeriana var. granulata TaxID=110450 RepID=A0A6G1BMG0_9ORYZ|nr:hypothetical protein E2562_020197 [Oryza meyeriana var. granulata]